LDLIAILGCEWGWSRVGVLDRGGDSPRGRGNFGGEFGHPIVSSGAFMTYLTFAISFL